MFTFMFSFQDNVSVYNVFMYVSFQEWLMFNVGMWRQELVPHKSGGSVMVAPKCITPMVG